MSEQADSALYFNGINGATGDYGLPPMSAAQLAGRIRGDALPANLDELRARKNRPKDTYGLPSGIDAKDLSQTGWGVIFPDEADPAIKQALLPLTERRKTEAGDLYRIFEAERGYGTKTQETKAEFLSRHGVGPGIQSPKTMPYYLLIVGSPEAIPYSFQRQLDVNYATGRIDFDTVGEYASYAESVVAAEDARKRASSLRQRAVRLFGVSNGSDPATNSSREYLIDPVAGFLQSSYADWQIGVTSGTDAKKAALAPFLGDQAPAVLFTASHGLEYPSGDARQRFQQGALLCADWPGRDVWGQQAIPPDFYYGGDDLQDNADIWGMIAFFFACYGGGTPRLNEFGRYTGRAERSAIAPVGFSAHLPQKMLAHPKGGALAVIAHVERAWEYSFAAQHNQTTGETVTQTAVFNDVMKQLLDGYPVGAAVEPLNERYAEISSDLSSLLESISFGKAVPDADLASLWIANNDARNYIVFGDPAVKIAVSSQPKNGAERPTFQRAVTVSAPAAAAPASPAPSPAAQAFGLTALDATTQAALQDSLKAAAQQLTDLLQTVAQNAADLEVKTYVTDSLSQFSPGHPDEADLRAFSVIKPDGNTITGIPKKADGSADTDLWEKHLAMVQAANSHRQAMLRISIDGVARLLGVLGDGEVRG